MTLKEKLDKIANSQFENWFDNVKATYCDSDIPFHFGLDTEDLESKIQEKIEEANCSELDIPSLSIKFRDEIIKDAALDWFNDRCSDFMSDLESHLEFIDNDHIKIYRAIQIKEEDFNLFLESVSNNIFLYETKGLGIYWSFHENATECHWGMNFQKARVLTLDLVAIAPISAINLEITALLNLDIACGSDEKEIRIQEDSYVNLIKINNKDVDLLVKV